MTFVNLILRLIFWREKWASPGDPTSRGGPILSKSEPDPFYHVGLTSTTPCPYFGQVSFVSSYVSTPVPYLGLGVESGLSPASLEEGEEGTDCESHGDGNAVDDGGGDDALAAGDDRRGEEGDCCGDDGDDESVHLGPPWGVSLACVSSMAHVQGMTQPFRA